MKAKDNNTTELLNTDSTEFEKKVQQLKNKYGTIYQIEIADQRYIFKPISRKEYKEVIKADISSESSITMVREELVAKKAIIYPEGKIVDELLENYAGVAEIITDECMKISGFLNTNEREIIKL